MNKQNRINKETEEINRINDIYKQLISFNATDEERKELVNELLSMQNEGGSWGITETLKCDSDMRVYYFYFPTYYATAALICADLAENYSETAKEKKALLKGLTVAMRRNLMGHGFDATRQMLDTLIIYKNAGLYRWMRLTNNASIEFCHLVHTKIAKIRDDLRNGNTVSDWDTDFKTDYERELNDYDAAEKSTHVWYACYGSNINKNRFMKYINGCTDKTPPAEDRPFRFGHNIYFAKSSTIWNGGGKAFIDDTAPGEALGRIYKITKAQFDEIKIAEGRDYSKCLHLGNIQGYPVYSFTDTQKNTPSNQPSDEYYRTILEGLQDCYNGILKEDEISSYLLNCVFSGANFKDVKTKKESFANTAERNYKSRIDAISLYGYKCQACGFDFSKTYGDIGKNYIEIHNVSSLINPNKNCSSSYRTDLTCLCANCHRMAHRSTRRRLTASELRDIISSD